ncbi:hypothetical protein ACC791_37325, partial [Rhizobium ruizarguesonis]
AAKPHEKLMEASSSRPGASAPQVADDRPRGTAPTRRLLFYWLGGGSTEGGGQSFLQLSQVLHAIWIT